MRQETSEKCKEEIAKGQKYLSLEREYVLFLLLLLWGLKSMGLANSQKVSVGN